MKKIFLPCLVLLLALSGCVGENSTMTDDELVKAVRAAAAANVSLQNAESHVGIPAALSTGKAGSSGAFQNLELDENQSNEITSLDVNDIVYWLRPVSSENASVVGLAWDTGQPPRVFFGTVYEP